MRVCVCNCGSHPRLSFIFRLSLFHLAFTSHRRPSPHRSRYDLGLDNHQSFDTTYPYYASHKPLSVERTSSWAQRFSIFPIFFSKFHTFSHDLFHRCFSMLGFPSCHDFLGRNSIWGFDLCSSTKTSGSWIASTVRPVATQLILRRQDCHEFCGDIVAMRARKMIGKKYFK